MFTGFCTGYRVWSENDLTSLKDDYGSMSKEELVNKYNRTYAAICTVATKIGLKRDVRYPPTTLTLIEIKKLYKSGKTLKEIAKIGNVSDQAIWRKLKNSSFKMRGLSEANRIYSINEHYFDKINTPEKAYILGLLYSDGCNHEGKNSIYINLQARDKHILEEINKLIGSNRPLRFIKRKSERHQDQYGLNITNKHISETLAKHGVIQNKVHQLTFPEWLDSKLYPHFIRGEFDGDGSIGKYNGVQQFSLAGHESYLARIQEVMMKELSLSKSKIVRRKRDTTVKLTWGGRKKVNKIMEWLYKDSTIHLHRKYDKWQSIEARNIGGYDNRKPLGIGIKSGKLIINIETGETYRSAKILSMEKELNYRYLMKQLNGDRTNKTVYKYAV